MDERERREINNTTMGYEEAIDLEPIDFEHFIDEPDLDRPNMEKIFRVHIWWRNYARPLDLKKTQNQHNTTQQHEKNTTWHKYKFSDEKKKDFFQEECSKLTKNISTSGKKRKVFKNFSCILRAPTTILEVNSLMLKSTTYICVPSPFLYL